MDCNIVCKYFAQQNTFTFRLHFSEGMDIFYLSILKKVTAVAAADFQVFGPLSVFQLCRKNYLIQNHEISQFTTEMYNKHGDTNRLSVTKLFFQEFNVEMS